jgi:hypothetical protein
MTEIEFFIIIIVTFLIGFIVGSVISYMDAFRD